MAASAEDLILNRYHEKCRMAGGPRVGFVLRKKAILLAGEDEAGVDLEAGLSGLVASEVLKASESGDFYFLTAAGVEKISQL